MTANSRIKEKLQNKEVIIRAFLRFPSPVIAEIMALSGVDLIVIDNEHYPFDEETICNIIRAAQCFGMECMIRVPNSEPTRIAQVMEFGCCGVVVPHVETYAEALQIVSAVKMVQGGIRRKMKSSKANHFGICPEKVCPYPVYSNDQNSIILMTETKTGLENLNEILSLAEIDGISIGPSDLSASFGHPGEIGNPEVQAAFHAGQKKIVNSGKALAVQIYHADKVGQLEQNGGTILTIGSDVQILSNVFGKWIGDVRAAWKSAVQEPG